MKPILLLLFALMFVSPARAAPRCWTLQPSQSRLTFSGDEAGAPARGEFKQFKVHLCFDPAGAKGQLRVVVGVASLGTHNSRRDEVLKGEDFFAVKQYPQAVYEARKFTRTADGRYTAAGTLKLRGVTRPVLVAFTFTAGGDKTAAVEGKAIIHRLDFGVGQGRWKNTRWVGNDVELNFDLHFTRSAA